MSDCETGDGLLLTKDNFLFVKFKFIQCNWCKHIYLLLYFIVMFVSCYNNVVKIFHYIYKHSTCLCHHMEKK